jgi:DNA-directed RNA polymerase subunit RPC12/RpoP
VLSKSVFVFSCICGYKFQKEEKEEFRCPECGRLLVLEWRTEFGGAGSEPVAVAPGDRND